MLSIMNRKQAEEIGGMPLANKGIIFFKIYWIFILSCCSLKCFTCGISFDIHNLHYTQAKSKSKNPFANNIFIFMVKHS